MQELSGSDIYNSNSVEGVVTEWHAIARLYHLVYYFAQCYNAPSTTGMVSALVKDSAIWIMISQLWTLWAISIILHMSLILKLEFRVLGCGMGI